MTGGGRAVALGKASKKPQCETRGYHPLARVCRCYDGWLILYETTERFDLVRVGSIPWPIISGTGPELAGLRFAAAGIEHGRRRLIGKQFWRGLQLAKQPRMHRTQMPVASVDRSRLMSCRA